MKNKLSQKERILKQLREHGKISRNACLKNYISRLSAYILEFKNEGMDIEAKEVDGDYVYYLLDKPEILHFYSGGELVATKKIWRKK